MTEPWHYSDGTSPADIVAVIFCSILENGFAGGNFGAPLVAGGLGATLLEAVPPQAVAAALRMFFEHEQPTVQPPEARPFFRGVWQGVRRWVADDPDRADVLAVMSVWVTRPAAVDVLEAGFVMGELRECLRQHTGVHDVGALTSALVRMVRDHPDTAEDILDYAMELRSAGLLQRCRRDHATALLEALGDALEPDRTSQLRSVLVFDRVIGPLALP